MPIQDRVTLITSSNYVFISSTITPDYVNGDTIQWNTPIINANSNYVVGDTVLFLSPAALQMVTLTMIDSVFDGSGNFIDAELTFLINFQNTGNDTARCVHI